MRLIISVLTGALTLGLAPALEAQKTPKKEVAPKLVPTERDGCVTKDGRTECIYRSFGMDSVMQKRPAIGVQLSPTGTMRDTLGVFVSRVTPKGPAENAGIVEGDRIVSINGVDLRVNSADAEDGYAADLPRRRLTREVGKLSPGNVATLRVWSGGRVRDVQVTVGRASDLRESGSFGFNMDGMPGAMRLMPNMDGMRIQLRDFPKIRMEQMRFPRMRFEQMEFPKMNMELRHLQDGALWEKLRDDDRWRLGPDGELIFERRKKTEAEAKKEQEKSKK